MTKSIGVLIAGVGFVGGQAHVPSFKKIKGSNLIGLVARTEKRVKPLAEKWDTNYYLDYDEALENPDVDAVVVAVPTPYHYEFALKAIEKGKHVMCEIPIAPKLDQIRKMDAAAKEADVTVMPILNFRFAPVYVKIKEMVKEGVVGKPVAMHYREFLPAKDLAEQWPAKGWAWDIDKAGGYPDFTLSVWGIDLLRWVNESEYSEYEWMASYPKMEQFGGIYGYNTKGIAKFKNDLVASFHFGASVNAAGSETRFEVYGDNTNVIHGYGFNKIKVFGPDNNVDEINLDVGGTKVWGHRQCDTYFIECLLNDVTPSVTLNDALLSQTVANKITDRLR
jgi:predicted dehydrogenase